MKRRLYYMLPDVPSARAMLDELLLARVEERYMHFYAKEGALPAGMPEANFFQKTDLIHGVGVGILIGAASGLIAGSLLLIFPPEDIAMRVIALLASALGGAVFGSWVSGMAAAAIPNSRLKPFRDGIERGQVLLIVDLPLRRVAEIEDMIARRHPEISFGGMEPHIPVFP
ncbi:MAG: DUF1269 domain-containing protein [Undibacterium sp.]|uniref:DUF1269 domain-containing protein n=1 Tax=Undibacterium sp. TaxID=1914977 RepID=UPI0027199C58|nr:DUF1269 domain-containing protein [Undibacterium sp.]MDO8650763.1 DUF1269 domain-containing protein [Undibacterium sp.]